MNNRYARLGLTLLGCAYFWHCAATYKEWHFIDAVNLVFHEAGHTIFFFLGEFVQVAAGSGLQVALPLGIALYFFHTRQKLSGALCLLWVAESLMNVSAYAGDAILMQLPLLGGDGVIHDWHYLLSTLTLLQFTPQVAAGLHMIGLLTLFLGSILAMYWAWDVEVA